MIVKVYFVVNSKFFILYIILCIHTVLGRIKWSGAIKLLVSTKNIKSLRFFSMLLVVSFWSQHLLHGFDDIFNVSLFSNKVWNQFTKKVWYEYCRDGHVGEFRCIIKMYLYPDLHIQVWWILTGVPCCHFLAHCYLNLIHI